MVQGDFSCTDDCTWTGTGAEPVTFRALPSSGNVLVAWGGVCPVLADDCTRTFEDGGEITATFAPHALRLDLMGDGEGAFLVRDPSIRASCDDDCGVPFDQSLSVQIIFDAEAGNRTELGAWEGDCDASPIGPTFCYVTVTGTSDVSKTWLHPPVAKPDTYQTGVNTTLTVEADDDGDGDKGVLDNDEDTEGDPLSVSLVVDEDVSHGTLTLDPDGGFEYVPDAGYEGVDTFRYRVRDAYGNTDEADVQIRMAVLTLDKVGTYNDANANGITDPGDTIDYTFTIENTGSVTLTSITLDDPDATLTGGPIDSLEPNTSDDSTFSGSYTITQADIDAGEVVNTATADSDQTNPTPDTHTTALSQDASLTLDKVGALDDANANGVTDPGDTIDYTFTIQNSGNVTLTSITLDDTLLGDTGGTLASLAPGASDATTFGGSYAITQADIDAGEVVNTATANSDQSPPDTDTVTVDLPQDPSLTFGKTGEFNDVDGDGFADVGDTIDYLFTVTNAGNVTLTGITVTDLLIDPTGDPIGDPIDSLAPGDFDTYTRSYAITQADIDAGNVDNTATANSDQANPTADEHTQPLDQNPVVDLTKAGTFNDANGNGLADVGETIDYLFTVTNAGNVTLTGITVTDLLIDPTGDPIGDPIDSLAPGDFDTYTRSYAITQADIDAGNVDNTATADSGESPPDTDIVTVDLPLE